MKHSEVVNWGRWRIAWVSPETVDAVVGLMQRGEVDGVGLCPHHGFNGDMALLNKLPNFSGVVVTKAETLDWLGALSSRRVRFISLGGPRSVGANFSVLNDLEDLRVTWHPDDVLPTGTSTLKSLYLRGYKPKHGNLEDLSMLERLEDLELVQSGIRNLEGVEKLKGLRTLNLSYCKTLVSVAALVGSSVERVHLEVCSKITDMAALGLCSHLKSIRLSACGDLDSLGFLKSSKTIEEFRFVRMKIADGDMTPLLNLKSVGFVDARGYSHTNAQVTHIAERCRQPRG